jgi:hypothetical protein
MWKAIADPTWDPTSTAAVDGLRTQVSGGGGSVHGGATSSDTERWAVDANARSLLRVSSRYDSGWSAKIDGRSTPVYRADGIFKAVVVPAGRHTVTFRYRNPAETAGRPLSAAGIIATAALALWPKRRLSRRRRARRRAQTLV